MGSAQSDPLDAETVDDLQRSCQQRSNLPHGESIAHSLRSAHK